MSQTFISSVSIPSWDEFAYRNDIRVPAEYAELIPQANEKANAKVAIWRGDISKLSKVDAIVSAERENLVSTGGVSMAIRKAAGPKFIKEIKKVGRIPSLQAKLVKGHDLEAENVILAVGPVTNDKNQLKQIYQAIFSFFDSNDFHIIAVPCISTGLNGFDHMEAADVALSTAREYINSSDERSLFRIIFVTYGEEDFNAYNKLIFKYFPTREYKTTEEIRKIGCRFFDLIRKRNSHNALLNTIPFPKFTKPIAEEEYVAIPMMYGGFTYSFSGAEGSYKLTSDSWCRVCGGSGERYVIDQNSTTLVDQGFV